MVTTETTTTLDREPLLTALFGEPGPHAYLRLSGANGAEWYRFLRGGWKQLGQFRQGAEPGPERLIALANNREVTFSPALTTHPVWSAPLHSLTFLWCVRTLPQAATVRGELAPRLDAATVAEVRERFATAPVPPSIVLHEGTRLSALWALTAALNVQRAAARLARLAQRPGADRDAAATDPEKVELALPGTVCHGVFPSFTITAEATEPLRRVSIEDLERWL